jgi:hypothetical protein
VSRRFIHRADHQLVRDFAQAELNALDGLERHVQLTPAGVESVERLRTELLAFVGDAVIALERGR